MSKHPSSAIIERVHLRSFTLKFHKLALLRYNKNET